MKRKYHLNFSKDSQFPSETHSYKPPPPIVSSQLTWIITWLYWFSTGSRCIVTSLPNISNQAASANKYCWTFPSNLNGLFTWKFSSVPYNDGVIHTAGCKPDIMRWPGDIHYIWIRFIENTTCASHNAKTEDNIQHLHEQRFSPHLPCGSSESWRISTVPH